MDLALPYQYKLDEAIEEQFKIYKLENIRRGKNQDDENDPNVIHIVESQYKSVQFATFIRP